MPESGHHCVERLRKRGKQLAVANKRCKGTKNNRGQFYVCVKRELSK